jgi:UDP-glucose 4-epimerase
VRHCAAQSDALWALGPDVESLKTNFPLSVTSRNCRLPRDPIDELLRQELPNALIHCIGAPTVAYSQQNPLVDFQNTVATTAHVLDAIARCSPSTRFVLVSSAAVYGDRSAPILAEELSLCPASTYGYHKWLAEILVNEFCLMYGVRSLVVRPFSVYGEGLRKQVLFDICRQLVSRKRVVLKGTGEERRDFMHRDDLAASIRHLVAIDAQGIVNVGTGIGTTIRSLARDLAALMNPDVELTFDGQRIPGDPASLVADTRRADELGVSHTVDLATGLRAYCDWFLHSLDR